MKALVVIGISFVLLLPTTWAADSEEKPLTPVEARKHVNEKITLQMFVKASKNRLEKHKEIYLDSETDYKDEKNMAVVINEEGAAKFKKAGVDEPAGHFKGKTIRITGTVTLDKERPRIVVSDPAQIRIVDNKE
jgi:hypothetical protein